MELQLKKEFRMETKGSFLFVEDDVRGGSAFMTAELMATKKITFMER